MTTDDKIRDLQYNLNREARKMPALSSRKIYNTNILQVKKYHLLMKIEYQDKLSLLILLYEKLLGKTNKTTENQGEKQIKSIEEHE